MKTAIATLIFVLLSSCVHAKPVATKQKCIARFLIKSIATLTNKEEKTLYSNVQLSCERVQDIFRIKRAELMQHILYIKKSLLPKQPNARTRHFVMALWGKRFLIHLGTSGGFVYFYLSKKAKNGRRL